MKILVKVHVLSGHSKIIKKGADHIAFLKSPPEKNKANNELLKLLKKKFKKEPVILKGKTSKTKLILLE